MRFFIYTMKIKDSVFIVTGGSSGIGKALAALLKEKGGKVVITGRDVHKLEKVSKEIGVEGHLAHMTSDEDLQKLVDSVINQFGRVDCLINNAGIGEFATVDDLNRAAFQRIFETNVFGAAILTSKLIPAFKSQNYGNIVNIGSSASVKGFANGSVYSASKFALRAMSECWRTELRPHNIRVMHVNPSEVTTAFNKEDRIEREEKDNKLRPFDLAFSIVAALELDDRAFIPEFGVWATNPF